MTYMPVEPELRDDKQDKPDERRRRRTASLLCVDAISILALLVGVGAWSQSSRRAETLAVLAAQRDAVPLVRTITAKAETEPRIIELPGSLAAFDSATLSARATGYISVRNADIGSKVRKGDG
jgi:multidrug efflux pump subunit AcrA (membrane-fusion protein)